MKRMSALVLTLAALSIGSVACKKTWDKAIAKFRGGGPASFAGKYSGTETISLKSAVCSEEMDPYSSDMTLTQTGSSVVDTMANEDGKLISDHGTVSGATLTFLRTIRTVDCDAVPHPGYTQTCTLSGNTLNCTGSGQACVVCDENNDKPERGTITYTGTYTRTDAAAGAAARSDALKASAHWDMQGSDVDTRVNELDAAWKGLEQEDIKFGKLRRAKQSPPPAWIAKGGWNTDQEVTFQEIIEQKSGWTADVNGETCYFSVGVSNTGLAELALDEAKLRADVTIARMAGKGQTSSTKTPGGGTVTSTTVNAVMKTRDLDWYKGKNGVMFVLVAQLPARSDGAGIRKADPTASADPAKVKGAMEACKDDIDLLCPAAVDKPAEALRCVAKDKDKVLEGCRARLEALYAD